MNANRIIQTLQPNPHTEARIRLLAMISSLHEDPRGRQALVLDNGVTRIVANEEIAAARLRYQAFAVNAAIANGRLHSD